MAIQVSSEQVATGKARRKATPDPSDILTDPNAILGVAEVAVLIGMSDKWVYETFSKMVPPRKTGAHGGGRSLWQRKPLTNGWRSQQNPGSGAHPQALKETLCWLSTRPPTPEFSTTTASDGVQAPCSSLACSSFGVSYLRMTLRRNCSLRPA